MARIVASVSDFDLRHPWVSVVGAMIAFGVVRGAHLIWAWTWPMSGDATGYDHLGWALVQGEPWTSWTTDAPWQFGPTGAPTAVRTPGLPLFLAAVYAVFGHEQNAARVALVLFNAIGAGALLSAVRRTWGIVPAYLVTSLWLFWPVSVRALYYLDSLLGESLAVPLLVFALWGMTRETWKGAVLAGISLGWAVLCRPHMALGVAVGVPIAILFLRPWNVRVLRFLLMTGVAVSCLGPWALRNYSAFGVPMPLSSQSGVGLWIGWTEGTNGSWDDTPAEVALYGALAAKNPTLFEAPEPEKSRIFTSEARAAILRLGPTGVMRRAAWKAWLFLRPWETFYGIHTALLLVSVLALLSASRSPQSPAGTLAWATWLGLLLTTIMTYYLGRYRFVSTPAVLFLAAGGISHLLKRCGEQPEPPGDSSAQLQKRK